MSTRTELKENILATKIEGFVSWVFVHRGPVLTGAGIVLVGFLIGSVFFIRSREMKDQNFTQLALAQSFLSQQQYPQADQVLQQVKTTSSDPTIQMYTSYFQGLSALEQKKFDQAAQFFSETVDKANHHPLRPLALSNMGFAFEQKRDYAAAAQTYGRFMTEYSDHFLAGRTQLALGRTLALAGKKEESKKALEQLIDLYPTSHWAENARSIMDKNKTR